VSGLRQIVLQANVDPNYPDAGKTQGIDSLQPVWPFSINEDYRLITYTLFISPKKADTLVWGAGPAIVLPTRSDPALGTNRVALDPAFLLFYPQENWSAGLVLQNGWSLGGGSGINKVNAFGAQYLPELQFAEGLVDLQQFDHHGELDGTVGRPLDRSCGRRTRQAILRRKTAAEHFAPIVLQRRHPDRWTALVGESSTLIPVFRAAVVILRTSGNWRSFRSRRWQRLAGKRPMPYPIPDPHHGRVQIGSSRSSLARWLLAKFGKKPSASEFDCVQKPPDTDGLTVSYTKTRIP
jgi:hypothetical protein